MSCVEVGPYSAKVDVSNLRAISKKRFDDRRKSGSIRRNKKRMY